jgi:hypothetical protein
MSEIILTVRLDGVLAVYSHRDLRHLGYLRDFPQAGGYSRSWRPETRSVSRRRDWQKHATIESLISRLSPTIRAAGLVHLSSH